VYLGKTIGLKINRFLFVLTVVLFLSEIGGYRLREAALKF